jgi:hypothetical protein
MLAHRTDEPSPGWVEVRGTLRGRNADELLDLMGQDGSSVVFTDGLKLGQGWRHVIDRLVEWSRDNGPKVHVHVYSEDVAAQVLALPDRHLWVEFIMPEEWKRRLGQDGAD